MIQHNQIQTNGITMHVAEAGSGDAVVLCHGFPELWYSWRHQIPALAEAGYHVLAPDQRGYGGTDRPQKVEDYDVQHLTDDLAGLLDAYGIERAVFAGHDWGAAVVWQMPFLQPDRVRAVVSMSVPFVQRSNVPPTQRMRELFGENFFYMLYFQDVGPADEELSTDTRSWLLRFLYTASGDYSGGIVKIAPAKGLLEVIAEEPDELMPWLTQDDLDYYTKEFERTGFTGGLNWYRNIDRNWSITEPFEGKTVDVPALFVAGEQDGVIRMTPVDAMKDTVPGVKIVMLPGAGHWTQQERPAEVNAALLEFLGSLPS